ncbi:MAG: serine/threonine protein kinase [Gammaproteobacteria bacterium]
MSEYRNSLQPGYKLHWYLIRSVLGQGGFGITYLAEDTNLDQLVAIKEFLPVEMAMREGDACIQPVSGDYGEQFKWGLERFISEAQTLARFKHENIVRVFTVFPENNTAYMIMECEQGQGLHEILKTRKTIPEDELTGILMPLLDGLEQIHEAGFIHRDIKPPNIFIREDGSPVLLDFGSARQSFGQQTRTLTSLISPGYAPFEQYVSKSDRQGPWTDVYGLGATLYRAVTGKHPLAAMDRSEALLHTGRDIYVPANEICRDRYSEGFLRCIDHAMAFKAADRPQSIASWRQQFNAPVTIEDKHEETGLYPAAASIEEPGKVVQKTVKITMQVPDRAEPQRPRTTPATNRGIRRAAAIVAVTMVILFLLSVPGKRHQQETAGQVSKHGAATGHATMAAATETHPTTAAVVDTSPRDEMLPSHSNDASVQNSKIRDRPNLISETEKRRINRLRQRLRDHPNDKRTLRQIRVVAKEYNIKIKDALRDDDPALAEAYLREVLTLAPNNKNLKEALHKIQKEMRQSDID